MRRILPAILAIGLALTPTSFAKANSPGSTFTGTFEASIRGGENIEVEGDLSAIDADCPQNIGNLELVQRDDRHLFAVLYHRETGDMYNIAYQYWGGGGSIWRAETTNAYPTSGDFTVGPTPTYVSQITYQVPAGTYDLGVAALYTGLDVRGKPHVCKVVSSNPVSIYSIVKSTPITRASSSSIDEGEQVTLTLVNETTWSDGIVTDEKPEETYYLALQSRTVGETKWRGISSAYGVGVDRPTASTEYRFVDDGEISKSVFVNVISPTVNRNITEIGVTPDTALTAYPLKITGTIETQYTDGQWRPSPVGTPYTIQFRRSGSPQWSDLAQATTNEPGLIDTRVLMTVSGTFRVISGSSISSTVEVTEIVPTKKVVFGEFNLPKQINQRSRLSIKIEAAVRYSDGIFRPATEGQAFQVQFRPLKSTRDRLNESRSKRPRWKTVRAGTIRKVGMVRASARVTETGYWRIQVGNAKTRGVLVTVR